MDFYNQTLGDKASGQPSEMAKPFSLFPQVLTIEVQIPGMVHFKKMM